MTDELFEIPECKSPKLLWMERFQIQTQQNMWEEWEDKRWPWGAFVPFEGQGFGNTQEEALKDLAYNLKIPLWNQ